MTGNEVLRLQQPLKDGGIRTVNFFNGRLLTSRDLSREQDAWRLSDARLGLAIGDGVASGLEVTRDDTFVDAAGPVVRVSAGVAVNREGRALRLVRDASIAVTRRFDAAAADACLFGPCAEATGGRYVVGAGVYLLTIAPSDTSEGRAATNGLDPSNVRCNVDANVEGLQFRLVTVTPSLLAGLDVASPSFRNELAYRCYGRGVQASWLASLVTAPVRGDDLVSSLRAIDLADSEIPLALLYMEGAATLTFVDMWAVRRPLTVPDSSALAGLAEPRRVAAGRAMLLQFQAQIAELAPPLGGLTGVVARDRFRYLPPVGVIPWPEQSGASDASAATFFDGIPYRGPAHVSAAQLEPLVRESLGYPPIDTQSGEAVWLYRVRENRIAIELGVTPVPQSYLVFSSGQLPWRADARFDLSSWNYANVAFTP